VKLAEETLLHILDIFRKGIVELRDMSQDLRDLELIQGDDGKLHVNQEQLTPQEK
jgi:hypothetical protein